MSEKEIKEQAAPDSDRELVIDEGSVAATQKSRWDRSWPVIACGSGLFSDGFCQAIIGPVNTMLKTIYKDEYTKSSAQQNVASIAFAGTVLGQLVFGWTSDHWSRKNSLLIRREVDATKQRAMRLFVDCNLESPPIYPDTCFPRANENSTIILIVFAALGAGSYGAGGSVQGLFAALTAYRFLLGIGIGGEYPAGSVACAESTGELKKGHRNRWFIFFTNFMIDAGFVVASLAAMIVTLACTERHLRAAWRICLGLAVIPPLSLIYLRIKLREPESYSRSKMTNYPWLLIIKFYGFRLIVVSLIWFIYDFSSYSFGIYSSSWLAFLLPTDAPLWKSFGWATVINAFYIPGSFFGAFLSDWIGPKYALTLGVVLQGAIGFLMSGIYDHLNQASQVGGFVVIYGIFLSLGEVGPGDNIGLIASKTSATSIRGQYYGIAAAIGKIGAFVGTYVFPDIIAAGGDNLTKQGQYPFFVSSALCIFSGIITMLFIPNIGQDTIDHEDQRFKEYLKQHGYDIDTLGTQEFKERRQSLRAGL